MPDYSELDWAFFGAKILGLAKLTKNRHSNKAQFSTVCFFIELVPLANPSRAYCEELGLKKMKLVLPLPKLYWTFQKWKNDVCCWICFIQLEKLFEQTLSGTGKTETNRTKTKFWALFSGTFFETKDVSMWKFRCQNMDVFLFRIVTCQL